MDHDVDAGAARVLTLAEFDHLVEHRPEDLFVQELIGVAEVYRPLLIRQAILPDA